MGCDEKGMMWDGMGWDGMGWDDVGWDGMGIRYRFSCKIKLVFKKSRFLPCDFCQAHFNLCCPVHEKTLTSRDARMKTTTFLFFRTEPRTSPEK